MSKEDNIEDQMEAVLKLMTKRSNGEVTNVQIESAVSEILERMGAKPPASRPLKKQKVTTERQINVDTVDYDDDDDNDEEEKEEEQAPDSIMKVKIKKEDKKRKKKDLEEYQDHISMIPLGREAAKMMTTFGDGPNPLPKAIETALMGTRETLQLSIMDARAIRRRQKQTFDEARQTLRKLDTSSLADASSLDPTMMSRALSSHDRLGKTIPCGFDIEQLRSLFPEEMRAYKRWNDMYELKKKSEDYKPGDEEEKAGVNHDKMEEDSAEPLGGHMKERSANFDARTEQMKGEWYLKYSQVRQGSFLPSKKRRTKEDIEWEKLQKHKRGRRVQSDWESMPAASVRFLHWLGFDPPNIMPPNDETTQALAFLGYDKMGQIIEKAIFLRNLKKINTDENQSENSSRLWELKEGEQLTLEEIEAALQDPEIQPKSLVHSMDSSSTPALQTYFGPGFEERLELEMEELAKAGKKVKLTAEELEFREEEAKLFAKISSAPSVLKDLNDLIREREENIEKKESLPKAEDKEEKD